MYESSLRSQDGTPKGISAILCRQIFLFVAVCLIIVYRQPSVLIEPRFWCEEGTYFFSFAFSHGWLETIFYVVPHLGFYSLAHNLAGLLATFIPLEQAPFVTTYLGFLSHILPCYIVILGNAPFWDSLQKKALICLGILFFPFGSIWLNTTYIHFTLALAIFLILSEKIECHNRLTIHFYRLILVLGGLSGVVSCFLTPVFVLKAWRSRQREHIIQAALLVLASAIQGVIIIYLFHNAQSAQYRFTSFGYDQLWSIIYFQFGIPFYGHSYFNSDIIKLLDYRSFAIVFPKLYPYLGTSTILFSELVTKLSVLLVIFYTCFILFKQIRNKLFQLPAISFLIMFVLSSVGSVKMMGGWRYIYVPCVIMVIMFVMELYDHKVGILRKSIAAFFILLMLMVNGYAYRKSPESYSPKWSEDVGAWYKDHNYKLKKWQVGWEMTLSPP